MSPAEKTARLDAILADVPVMPVMTVADPAEAVAQQVAASLGTGNLLDSHPLPHNDNLFFVSGEQSGVQHWIEKLLPNSGGKTQPGPIFKPIELLLK